MRILIVDDNPVVRFIQQQIFSSIAYVETTDNPQEAIELHQRQSYNFILMDVNLPIMNGIEATQRIRAFEDKVAILGLTGKKDPQTQEACLAAGMQQLFIKPVSHDELKRTLMQLYYV